MNQPMSFAILLYTDSNAVILSLVNASEWQEREIERWNIFSVSLDRHNAGDLSTLHHTRQSVGTRPLMIAMCVCVRFILHSTATSYIRSAEYALHTWYVLIWLKTKLSLCGLRHSRPLCRLSSAYITEAAQVKSIHVWLLSFIVADFSLLARELSALPTLIVSQRVSLWVCLSTRFQNAFSPAVLIVLG